LDDGKLGERVMLSSAACMVAESNDALNPNTRRCDAPLNTAAILDEKTINYSIESNEDRTKNQNTKLKTKTPKRTECCLAQWAARQQRSQQS